MNIPKAIEILTKLEKTLAPTMAADETDAQQLGIEALKRVQDTRVCLPVPPMVKLPGETKE